MIHLQEFIDEIIEMVATCYLPSLGMEPAATVAIGDCEQVSACVWLSGAWQGGVILSCTTAFARTVAGLMYARDSSSMTHDEIMDSLAELVNVVGGNVKALVEGPCEISLPVVTRDRIQVPSLSDEIVASYRCDGELQPLVVRVFTREADDKGAYERL